jgi:hypothetical protein
VSAKTTLPVRRPMAAETELMNRFMDEHGDDLQDWSQQTVLDYAAAVAALRSSELNSKKVSA